MEVTVSRRLTDLLRAVRRYLRKRALIAMSSLMDISVKGVRFGSHGIYRNNIKYLVRELL